MCGIFGCRNMQIDSDDIKICLQHRGPDAFGSKIADDWNIYHARLSILDLTEAGTQPMEADGNIICFNGEIYNHKELYKQYLCDCPLKSASDTEVLLLLLNKYGMKILNKLNGMFAFAYYDKKQRKMYLVRDRFGVKPLYYYQKQNQFAFCSEDRVLFDLLKLPLKFNHKYMERLIENSESDYDELSTFENIYQVKAGEYISIDYQNSIQKHVWYDFTDTEFNKFNFKNQETVEEYFENLLVDSIRLRNVADVNVGITLSGGLDSSLIYVLAKEKLGKDYKIFTYSNAKETLDEFATVNKLTQEYGDKLTKIEYCEDTMEQFVESLKYLNAPIWAASHVGYYNVYKRIKENNIKVILEGHGADESLGGWPWTLGHAAGQAFREGKFRLSWKIFKVQQQTWNTGLNQKSNENFRHYLKLLKKFNRKNCFSKLLKNLFDKTVLPINLRCFDRLSMANSIESRSPFLDYRIVEFLRNLPIEYKVNAIGNKAILRNILLKYNKDYIVQNKVKQGYLSSEIEFMNQNSEVLLSYLGDDIDKYDVKDWRDKNISYGYDTKLYRIIAFKILEKLYS